jgi:hypothetical protein
VKSQQYQSLTIRHWCAAWSAGGHLQRKMCRGEVLKCEILNFLDEEYVQVTESDNTNYETEDDDDMFSIAKNQESDKISSAAAVSTAAFILFLIFSEIFLVYMYVLPEFRNNPNQIIAHRLCKKFPAWQFIENMTDSWCSPRVFNKEFRMEVQCQCFAPAFFKKYYEL